MQLSQNQKKFSQVSATFLKSNLNFRLSGTEMALIDFVFPKLQTPKT